MARSKAFFIAIFAVCITLIPVVCSCEYVSREGFITLEISDSHDLDYTHIFPLLESYGYKASFAYITETSDMGIENDPWMMQEIHMAGHEVQDHTTRHNYMWHTFIDTVDDGEWDWIPYTFADVATWDSLCERSLFICDSLGIDDVVGFARPGGICTDIPGHPGWSSLSGPPNDSLYGLIGTKYPYALLPSGAKSFTAHLNLRGHNYPDLFPFFHAPHVTIDKKGVEEIKTEMADATAAGLWYLAQCHVWKMERVAKMESLLEWLDTTDIEVLKCVDGWQRIAYGDPDPLANQFPQAKMLQDRDGNNKPDGFLGSCVWDTCTATPVESTFCITVFDETWFYCYGPEVGPNALSLWVRSRSCNDDIRIVWVTYDFDRVILENGYNTFCPDTGWVRVDSTICPNMVIDVGDEVDHIKIIIRTLECDSVSVAYPELFLNCTAGVETAAEGAAGTRRLVVRPNPARCGEVVRIDPAPDVLIYDVLGRHIMAPRPSYSGGGFAIDTSRLAPGVYFITCRDPGRNGAHLIVIR